MLGGQKECYKIHRQIKGELDSGQREEAIFIIVVEDINQVTAFTFFVVTGQYSS